MFIEERHQAILEMIEEKGSVTTAEIKDRFGISYDSAKRDLRLLEEAGKLRRTHGGAIPVGELNIGARRAAVREDTACADECARIAGYAASLIADGDMIFLPSSTLGELVARSIPRGLNIRVLTGSLTVADTLRRREGVRVTLLGGEVDSEGRCFDGFAVDMIRRFRIDKAFIATEGVSAEFGVSVRDGAESQYCAAAVKSARKAIGIYPGERIGLESGVSVCEASCLDAILTGTEAGDGARTALERLGVSVVICP